MKEDNYFKNNNNNNNNKFIKTCLFLHFKNILKKINFIFFSLLQINIFWCFQIILIR
jgi:hypothetical protein